MLNHWSGESVCIQTQKGKKKPTSKTKTTPGLLRKKKRKKKENFMSIGEIRNIHFLGS
jgi:hypothetical protein